MPDAVELMKTVKRAALDAVNASKPVEVCFGKVTSTSPLNILVEQKMTLGETQLVISRHVTDYKAYMTEDNVHDVNDGKTQQNDSGSLQITAPNNDTGKIPITIHNGLVVGDEVILLRQQGGQKYIVVDKIK